jgi:diaminopropionate ammonia-lyase
MMLATQSAYLINPHARNGSNHPGLFTEGTYRAVNEFFSGRSGFSTPLRRLSGLARCLGINELLVKDESSVGGLDSFKIRGVSYAVDCLLKERRIGRSSVLACATDGNHGRAVARVAHELDLRAHVFVPGYTVDARIAALEAEGATVTIVNGGYDDALRELIRAQALHGWTIISDTSWPDYEDFPLLVMAGYTSLLEEASKEWGTRVPDIVFVQAGVGGLAASVLSWFCHYYRETRPYLISCEPLASACCLESCSIGRRTVIRTQSTVMAGLNCGEVSFVAFPLLAAHTDAFVAIEDRLACQAVYRLACPMKGDELIASAPSGACGLASLLAVLQREELAPVREACRIGRSSRVLVINTEGITDPELHRQLLENGLSVDPL